MPDDVINGTDFPSTGVVLSSGDVSFLPDNDSGQTQFTNSNGGNSDLDQIIGAETNDACRLFFDFECVEDPCLISFDYVWGSDEYLECKHFHRALC